ncbi:MAG TPA: iron-sulfur cluster co-chaperone HscB C-terminal domain-containing protein [Planctomycetota bacterium]
MNSPATAAACPSCGQALATPLLCEACGALLAPARAPTPFEAFGLEPGFVLDLAALRRRHLALSRELHPDMHARAEAETRRRAEDGTAALNAAYQVLADEDRRADWLVRALGGPGEDQERAMPQEFLLEVLEWNEKIEEARSAPTGSAERARLDALVPALESERARRRAAVGECLTPLPPAGAPALRRARQELNALRYLERALTEVGELRLAVR